MFSVLVLKYPFPCYQSNLYLNFEKFHNFISAIAGSIFFANKTSHKNKHLCKISFSNDIWFYNYGQTKSLMVFVHYLLSWENEEIFFNNIFTAKIVKNLFENHILFENVEKKFLIDIMMYNRHRCCENYTNV